MLHCPRNITRTLAYSGFFLATCFTSAFAADPTGDWKVADGVANIRVAECNGSMWGAVSWEKAPGGHEKKKPGVDQWEGQVYNGKDGQFYSSTIKPVGPDQLEIQGCVLGFLCGGETWTRVAGPIPSSPANSMARSAAPKTAGAPLPKTAAPITAATAPKTNPAPKMPGQKPATTGQPADAVGDICLLPDIAGFAH
jgi:hypothetical protein